MEKLLVPVYLNQKLVFDLLAMLQGGISTVTAVTRTTSESKEDQQKMSVGFGLSEAFSTLLRIDLSGDKAKSEVEQKGGTASEERVHTPASLFYELRGILVEKQFLKEISTEDPPKPGDFVEFEGVLKRNPIVETLDSFTELMKIVETFEEEPKPSSKGKKFNQPSENLRVRQQITSLSESLKAGRTIDLTADSLRTGHTAVITVETGFLNDPMMSDLVDGQFKVIGKVVKSVEDDTESISLLRKTALSKMPSSLLSQIFESLSAFSEQGFSVPEMKWEVSGPAIQILPIAIYA